MQPTLTQVPPKRSDSAMATRAPWLAATRLARTPPEPPPIVKRSKSKLILLGSLLQIGQVDFHQLELGREALVLRLGGERLEGGAHLGLHLRAGGARDA